MQAVEIQEHARKLVTVLGDKAIPEAAQKAQACERAGDEIGARNWRRIESALMQMRGPRES
mgnify:CR=1 FL=1